MSTELSTSTGQVLATASRNAGLTVESTDAGTGANGTVTARVRLAGASTPLLLEVSEGFQPTTADQQTQLAGYLEQLKGRLQSTQPELYVTLSGLPLRFHGFQWPFHRSTSGADTYIVHGTVQLADGTDSPLHAKISASMTVTFAEVVAAPEQPYAEDFIYNAVRKTFDYSQLELLKSGNRQPVPVTMRYYSRWQKKFLFADTTAEQRRDFLLLKAFWLSAMQANSIVWLADPRDAQYLNTTIEELEAQAASLLADGSIEQAGDRGYARATAQLKAREPEFRARLEEALHSIKPAFNEEMRAGHTNM